VDNTICFFHSSFSYQSKWQAFKYATLSGLAEPLGVVFVGMLFFVSIFLRFYSFNIYLLGTHVNVVTAAAFFPSNLNPEILEGLLASGKSVSRAKSGYSYLVLF
jgi:ZIP family zinc transporter